MAKKGQTKSTASRRSKLQRRYNSTPTQKKRRAARNKARQQALASGKVSKGDGKDIHHTKRKSLSGKTVVQSASTNRANNSQFSKKRKAKRKNP